MEYYQAVQNRTAQTVAVIRQFVPALSVAELAAAMAVQPGLAQALEDRVMPMAARPAACAP